MSTRDLAKEMRSYSYKLVREIRVPTKLCGEVADEIERLREAVTKLGGSGIVAGIAAGCVSVPIALLLEVLDVAERDSVTVEMDRACNQSDHEASREDQDRILELRRMVEA